MIDRSCDEAADDEEKISPPCTRTALKAQAGRDRLVDDRLVRVE